MIRIIFIFMTVFSLAFGREIELSSPMVKQGEFITLTLPGDFKGVITFKEAEIKYYSHEDAQVAFIPVHYSTPVGSYPLRVSVGEDEIFREDITVTDGNFKKSYITVDSKMQQKRSPENMKKMINHAREARRESTKRKLWTGTFILPVDAPTSSPFGAIRFVNGSVSGYHSGLDFAAPVGTPVKAPNNGRVVLAMYLTSSGNTIIIDHGYNLFTSYSHLDILEVHKGQEVAKGDLIATTGNTGFTTGPHLHFTASVGNIFVNPYLLIDSKLLE